jgi:PAS domain S-box-containing protein
VLWNAAAADLFGYNTAEALGQSLNLIILEHLQKDAVRQHLRAACEIPVVTGSKLFQRKRTWYPWQAPRVQHFATAFPGQLPNAKSTHSR